MKREEYHRLGQLLIRGGHITTEQLEHALEQQKGSFLKLGELMVQSGVVNQNQIDEALEIQARISFTLADSGPRPSA